MDYYKDSKASQPAYTTVTGIGGRPFADQEAADRAKYHRTGLFHDAAGQPHTSEYDKVMANRAMGKPD